jgi:5-formyltetrahydrofolate cyclo-ligase
MVDQELLTAKKSLRKAVLSARKQLAPETLELRAQRFGEQLEDFAVIHGAATVTAYASVGEEPGTRVALDRLHARGIRILLPIVLPDLDLDWAEYTPDEWEEGRMGLVHPTSPPSGVEAIREADIVFCPGVAGNARGHRLGRGGGCYDRALARTRPGSTRCLVIYDEDVVDEIPVDDHDQRVDVIITPTRVIEIPAADSAIG